MGSDLVGHFRTWGRIEDAPHTGPLPRPVVRAREGARLAALGEGDDGLRAWCLYLKGWWCAAVMKILRKSRFLGGK